MSVPADPAPGVVVVAAGADAETRAASLAARLGAPLAAHADDAVERVALRVGVPGEPLELIPPGDDGPVTVDAGALARARRGRDDLLRAVRLPDAARPEIIDATAGLGADGFALAAAGCRVRMLERQPVLALLLEEALGRAAADPALAPAAARVTLRAGDATALLAPAGPLAGDVILLDPMYPEGGRRARRRARTGKAMRLFRSLVGDDDDAPELLAAALGAARRKVVVKRPARAAPLAGPRPNGSIEGRTTRFDLYAPRPG